MVMRATVAGLRKAASSLLRAEGELQAINAVLQSKAFARDMKQLLRAQNAIAELALIAPRLDTYERATEFMASLSEAEDMIALGMDQLDPECLWEQLESKALERATAHVGTASDALSEVDAESEWVDENPSDDDEDE